MIHRKLMALVALVALVLLGALVVTVTWRAERDDRNTVDFPPPNEAGPDRHEQPDGTLSMPDVDVGPDGGGPSGTSPDIGAMVPGPVLEPVSFDESAEFGDGVQARVVAVVPTHAEAHLPGERSGPGVIITLELRNTTSRAVDVDNVTVDLAQPDGTSYTPITDRDLRAISGMVPPNGTVTGQYLFAVDKGYRHDARLLIKYAADAPTAVFAGALPVG